MSSYFSSTLQVAKERPLDKVSKRLEDLAANIEVTLGKKVTDYKGGVREASGDESVSSAILSILENLSLEKEEEVEVYKDLYPSSKEYVYEEPHIVGGTATFKVLNNDGKVAVFEYNWPENIAIGKTIYNFKGTIFCRKGMALDPINKILMLQPEYITMYYNNKFKEILKPFRGMYNKVQSHIDVDHSKHIHYAILDTVVIFRCEIEGKN